MRSKFLNIFFGALAIAVLYFTSVLYEFFHIPLVKKGVQQSIKVYPNQSATIVSQTLYQQHILQHPELFEWLVAMMGNRFQLHFGEYQIQYPITAWQLLKNMSTGTGLVKHRLTIVEGWTFQNIREAMAANPDLSQTITKESNAEVMQQLKSSFVQPEGLFYPNTYFFTWGNTDLSVLKMAYQKMQTLSQAAWKNRASNLPYQNVYQALIVASMIEKETALSSERPLVASVIMNRLAKHMRLQIDPTVQYGVGGKFTVVITKTDLLTKTPYNTYLIDGLPPTPICMPSISSIEAALHPATTDYLYYVANGKGGHTFSETYVEHQEAVAVYHSQQH
ncbi:MAG: endolytic transglycosylase MltG [Coxiellaceae bacterium]|nr:endolytic transglycosylase MltG [Coxiellaceae bacterium]